MCTVTFSPRQRGYVLAMNRDEKLSRAVGLPPARKTIQGRAVLAPAEPGGGTWITVNDTGTTFALINWYAIARQVKANPVSRGNVVRRVSSLATGASATMALEEMPLHQVNPFRLIGVFPGTKEVLEWRWDLQQLTHKINPWCLQQWISSGFDEAQAQLVRAAAFQAATLQKAPGTLAWLRRLHRSHRPAAGPFSTCMHRADAATVSYTEVRASRGQVQMNYFPGAPCQCANGQIKISEVKLRLQAPPRPDIPHPIQTFHPDLLGADVRRLISIPPEPQSNKTRRPKSQLRQEPPAAGVLECAQSSAALAQPPSKTP